MENLRRQVSASLEAVSAGMLADSLLTSDMVDALIVEDDSTDDLREAGALLTCPGEVVPSTHVDPRGDSRHESDASI